MKKINETMEFVNRTENTDSSFCKIGNSAQNLIVSFGHVEHGGFASKSSLIEKKHERNNFDILYMRDVDKRWYLNKLPGIGESVEDTIVFLKNETRKYRTSIFVGSSMGGYAAILFGSLLNAKSVIAQTPQTDLNYLIENNCCSSLLGGLHPEIFKKYGNLNNIINNKTEYIMNYHTFVPPDSSPSYKFLHGEHHYKNIKDHNNVTCFIEGFKFKQAIFDCINGF